MNEQRASVKSLNDYGTPVLQWSALDFQQHNRGSLWAYGAGISVMILLGISLWQRVYSFSILILLLAGVYFLQHRQKPKMISIVLTTNGIVRHDRFFPFEEILYFWILFRPDRGQKEMTLVMKKGMLREVKILLGEQDVAELRSFLEGHIFEHEDREENIVEKSIRFLKL